MVENIHDRRAAIKDAVATLSSLEKNCSKKKIPINRRLMVRQQVKNIYEKSKCCRSDLFEAKKKYTETIMRNRKKESAKNLKSVKMEKNKKSSKIIKKAINGMCTVQHKKSSKTKVRLSKNTSKNKKQSGPKKKGNQGKRNVKEVKRKVQVKDAKKKICPKKILIKNTSKKNVKLYKKRDSENTSARAKNKNVENGIKHINNHKNVKKVNSLDNPGATSEGLEIIQVIVDVHRIETEKDVLKIDTYCDDKYSKDTKLTDCPKEKKIEGSYVKNKLENKLKDIVNEVNNTTYTCLYDTIKRKERKASRLAMNNQLTESKSPKPLKRKLTVSNVNENRSRKSVIKKPKLSKYMSKKS